MAGPYTKTLRDHGEPPIRRPLGRADYLVRCRPARPHLAARLIRDPVGAPRPCAIMAGGSRDGPITLPASHAPLRSLWSTRQATRGRGVGDPAGKWLARTPKRCVIICGRLPT